MSIAGNGRSGKSAFGGKGTSLVERAQDLEQLVERAAGEGCSLHQLERGVLDSLLQMGHAAVEQFLTQQGDGDLGESVTTDDGQTLSRRGSPTRPTD